MSDKRWLGRGDGQNKVSGDRQPRLLMSGDDPHPTQSWYALVLCPSLEPFSTINAGKLGFFMALSPLIFSFMSSFDRPLKFHHILERLNQTLVRLESWPGKTTGPQSVLSDNLDNPSKKHWFWQKIEMGFQFYLL